MENIISCEIPRRIAPIGAPSSSRVGSFLHYIYIPEFGSKLSATLVDWKFWEKDHHHNRALLSMRKDLPSHLSMDIIISGRWSCNYIFTARHRYRRRSKSASKTLSGLNRLVRLAAIVVSWGCIMYIYINKRGWRTDGGGGVIRVLQRIWLILARHWFIVGCYWRLPATAKRRPQRAAWPHIYREWI